MYTQDCSQCLNSFDSKRPATYCSAACRVTANRVTDKSKVVTDNVTDNFSKSKKDIKEVLEELRVKYGYQKLTKEFLTQETGIQFSFVPSWIRNGLTLEDIKSL